MLELIPSGLHLDFIGKAKFFIALSLLVILVGIGSILHAAASIWALTFEAARCCNCASASRWN